MAHRWEHIVCDRYGTPLGEIENALVRTTNRPLGRVVTGSITLETRNPMVPYLRLADQTYIKVYRNGVLMGVGPCVPGYQKQVMESQKTCVFNWTGAGGWQLAHRAIEASKTNSGVSYGTPGGPLMDRGAMAVSIINGLNSATPPTGVPLTSMDTTIRIGSVPTTSSTAVGPWYYKNALQGISELAATLDGFDWSLDAQEPVIDGSGVAWCRFNCALAYGALKPDAVWEYGDGKLNVSQFTESTDYTGALIRAYSLPPAFPNDAAQSVLSYTDPAAATNVGSLYEDVVPSDFTVDDMRMRLLQESVRVRKTPKLVVEFTPTVDPNVPGYIPQYGADFVEGDIMQFRAVEYDQETINALFRCYGVTFSVDQEGNETMVPTLISQDT
jgi:hypothetical protein